MTDTNDSGAPRANLLDLSVKIAALTAALLPAIGGVMRWVSLMGDRNVPREVYFATSVGTLAATALDVLVPAAFGVVTGYVVIGRTAPAPSTGSAAVPRSTVDESGWVARVIRYRRTLGRALPLFLAAMALALVVTIVMSPGSLSALASGGAGVVMGILWSRMRRSGPLTFGRVLPSMLAYLLFSALLAGLLLMRWPAAQYVFDDRAGVGDGWYVELGRGDGLVYLKRCDDSEAQVRAIRADLVLSVEFAARPEAPERPGSFWGALTKGEALLQVRYACPSTH